MKTGPETHDPHFYDSDVEDRIDYTLRMIGSVDPRPGIEKRITARLADASAHTRIQGFSRIFGLPRLALASAAGMAACVAIIAGSVNHSRHMVPVAPGIQLISGPSDGVGAAAAVKVAPKPVAAPAHGRARSVRKAQNSAITPDAQKPDAVGVPRTPLPQPQN
jgi:hypothetical protein